MSAPAVEVSDASRSFGSQQVLAGINLTIEPGEFVAMLGHSGSGKSTLLRAMAGLDGDVLGSVVVPLRRAVVFQNPRLLPWKRVLANVVFSLGRRDALEAGRQALAEVGLTAKERAWPATLSGGEAQRVSLARALVREPDLLLLDEPFGALDALTRLKMYDLLQALWQHRQPAVLHVTHDVDEAIVLADRIVVLRDGVIAADHRVGLARPRQRAEPGFADLRDALLTELGVNDHFDSGGRR